MEIVKYVKVVPRLITAPKNAKKQIVTHVSRKKYRRVSVWGLALEALPQTFAYAWKTTQDRSSLVMGSGAEPRPKTVLV